MDGKRSLALGLSLAFAAACGGGASTTTSASAAAATSAPSAAATAAATQAASGPKLSDILSASKATSYKVTYKISGSGPGVTVSDTEQTWYFKPPRSRFDFALTVQGQTTLISFFSLPEGQFSCLAATGAPTTCFSIAGAGSPIDQNSIAMTQRDLIDNTNNYANTFKETRTIAGVQGNCYEIKPGTAGAAGLESGTFCWSKEGIPLFSQYKAQGSSWTMEATKLSTTVSDADFVLPAKPL